MGMHSSAPGADFEVVLGLTNELSMSDNGFYLTRPPTMRNFLIKEYADVLFGDNNSDTLPILP